MSPTQRPLVVLAGWLGCQKHSLKRYEQLFASKGFDVLSEVATPTMVVEACFPKTMPPPALKIPKGWPNHSATTPQGSMQDFTWDILRQIYQRDPSYFIFYAFSNGGCFVWEQMRGILNLVGATSTTMDDDNPRNDGTKLIRNEEEHRALQTLQTKTAGVIFDSCPSFDLVKVSHALAYCTPYERLEIAKGHGLDIAFFPSWLSPSRTATAEARGKVYGKTLLEDTSTTPQLYIYSQSDSLIPATTIDELVDFRRQLVGKDRIFRRKFVTSRHCAHFIDNKEEYAESIESFLQVCQQNTRSSQPTTARSKL